MNDQKKRFVFLEYYQRPFSLFHQRLDRDNFTIALAPDVRRRFWSFLDGRVYSHIEIFPLIGAYLRSLEGEIKKIVSKHSIAYWYHLYRRIAPTFTPDRNNPITVYTVRKTMEAAFQKYGSLEFCSGIAISDEIGIEEVFSGLLMESEFLLEKGIVEAARQVVLKDFTHVNLIEMYDLELLCYEIWRTSALLRISAKGADIEVDTANPLIVFDTRSAELDEMVRRFDERLEATRSASSSIGIVVGLPDRPSDAGGMIVEFGYNTRVIAAKDLGYDQLLERHGLEFNPPDGYFFNFGIQLFHLGLFRDSHLQLQQEFFNKYQISLDSVLGLVSILNVRNLLYFQQEPERYLLRLLQRAYFGPMLMSDIVDELAYFKKAGLELLGISGDEINNVDLNGAIRFWTLGNDKLAEISLTYAGPHSLFVPFGRDNTGNELFMIDFAAIPRRLYDLFHGLSLTDQAFKGQILEDYLLQRAKSVLPTRELHSFDGTSRQVDASIEVDSETLLVIECKAISQSIGFLKGQKSAVDFRIRKVEEALDQVFETVEWLTRNPIGSNYNVENYNTFIPVVVTPFVEYLPGLTSRYWIGDGIPRVLTPDEVLTYLDSGELSNIENTR